MGQFLLSTQLYCISGPKDAQAEAATAHSFLLTQLIDWVVNYLPEQHGEFVVFQHLFSNERGCCNQAQVAAVLLLARVCVWRTSSMLETAKRSK
jgi:hypothetical protein